GGIYQREGIELRDRQMLNMAALAAMGGVEPQLTGHIKTAVDVAGMSKEEVAECFVHLMPYIGVPKTLAAMRCMKSAFDGYGAWPHPIISCCIFRKRKSSRSVRYLRNWPNADFPSKTRHRTSR